jgi:nifR3 family TIM-barrel protein
MYKLSPLQIGDVVLDNPIFLAPMAGITDRVFRRLCREQGCAMSYTEMVSAKGLHYAGKNTFHLLDSDPDRPNGVQIFGREPEIMAEQVAGEDIQSFDIIDINMGCPARKIVSNGEGSALMRNLPQAQKVITACVQASKKPITVKFRAGWDADSINAVEFALMAQEAGAAAVTVHGRTTEQAYSGKADRGIIRRVKEAVTIPVIGNGDIFSAEDAVALFEETNCDGVMVARGARGNPWIFREIINLCNGVHNEPVDIEERKRVMLKHIDEMLEHKPERTVLLEMRKHIQWYLKGLRGSTFLRTHVYSARSTEEMRKIVMDL